MTQPATFCINVALREIQFALNSVLVRYAAALAHLPANTALGPDSFTAPQVAARITCVLCLQEVERGAAPVKTYSPHGFCCEPKTLQDAVIYAQRP